MNANADVENRLQQLGRLLKTRQSSANSVLEQMKSDVMLEPIKSAARPLHRCGLIGALSIAGCAFLVMGWMVFSDALASRAFAQVRQAVQEMRSAVISYESKNQPELDMKVYLLKSGEFRQEFAGGLVRIVSPQEERSLGLDVESKTAWFSPEKGVSDAWFPIQRILEAQQSAVRKLGDRKRDGVTLSGFLLSKETDPVRVEMWVDSETHLPVEINESPSTPGDPLVSHRQAKLRFEFNKELAPSLFNMAPPAEFRLVENGPRRPMPTFPRGIDMRKFQLKPGIGIGGLTWGADLPAVVAYYGPPSELLYRYTTNAGDVVSREKPDGVSIDHVVVKYDAFGLRLRVKEENGLFSVSAEEGIPNLGIRTFPGKTTETIAIGATLNEVKEAYGKPSRSRGPADSPFALIYGDRGVAFVLAEGRVTAITITVRE